MIIPVWAKCEVICILLGGQAGVMLLCGHTAVYSEYKNPNDTLRTFGTSGGVAVEQAVRRSTGNDVSGPLFSSLFFLFFSSVVYFSHRRSALIKKLI